MSDVPVTPRQSPSLRRPKIDPILLVHGYSSEGKDKAVRQIYGSLPSDLRKIFGRNNVREINLSRWISLSDGVSLDDVSFAMDRALKAEHADLLENGFNIIIHSTGALVVRNWIRKYSARPSPVNNLIHLAGANFGSGLAHVGRGQLSRWGRLIFQGTGSGIRILNELEFGSWRTIDMHLHFLAPGKDMYNDYQVHEYCIIGSQTLKFLRVVPIRYVKEDSADNTVRTSACNLNFNYVTVRPLPKAFKIGVRSLGQLVNKRLSDESFTDKYYEVDLDNLSHNRQEVPFAVVFETAHFGDDIGIVSGKANRDVVMPLIEVAISKQAGAMTYQDVVEYYRDVSNETLARAAALKSDLLGWNKQAQYEGHAQLIFRLKDQYGKAVEHFDISIKSEVKNDKLPTLEKMIEDHHGNKLDKGAITFYLRTQSFSRRAKKQWRELLENISAVNVEVTGYEAESEEISYIPMNIELNNDDINSLLQSFRTTIVDITLVRLPSRKVFEITKA